MKVSEEILRKAIRGVLDDARTEGTIGGDGRLDPGESYWFTDKAKAVDGLVELWKRVALPGTIEGEIVNAPQGMKSMGVGPRAYLEPGSWLCIPVAEHLGGRE